ncbi:hypothetical protein ACUUL3_04225 [Thiovibrio sp. JS02]
MIEKYDKKEWHCRMLGMPVPFGYCRIMREGRPCPRILDCWFELIPIRRFIEENYSPEEIHAILAPPQSRLDAIAEVLNRRRKDEDG